MTEPHQTPLLRLVRSRRVMLAAGVVVLVGVVAFATVASRQGEATRSAPTAQTPLGEVTPVPRTTATPGATPDSPDAVPVPRATAGERTTTEVEAASPETTAPPAPPRVASLLPGGAPPAASELGKLVKGFPETVPIVGDSTIESSSINSNGATVQATVVATTSNSAADIVDVYQKAFAALGLASSNVQSSPGEQAIAFARETSSVTLTVGKTAQGVTTYSLFAVIALTP